MDETGNDLGSTRDARSATRSTNTWLMQSLWMVEAHVQDAPLDARRVEEPSASRRASQP